MPEELPFDGFEMHWAGMIAALINALPHATNWPARWARGSWAQVHAFAFGAFGACWLERSKSAMAPNIGHTAGDVVEYAIVFRWVGFLQASQRRVLRTERSEGAEFDPWN